MKTTRRSITRQVQKIKAFCGAFFQPWPAVEDEPWTGGQAKERKADQRSSFDDPYSDPESMHDREMERLVKAIHEIKTNTIRYQ